MPGSAAARPMRTRRTAGYGRIASTRRSVARAAAHPTTACWTSHSGQGRKSKQKENPADHRQPDAPKYNDAYTVCVPSRGSKDHTELHSRLNKAVNASGSDGLTTFGKVKQLSFNEVDKLDPEVLSPKCKEVYKRVLTIQYEMPDSTSLCASPCRPLPSQNNEVGQALSKAWKFTW